MGKMNNLAWSFAAVAHMLSTAKIQQSIDAQNAALGIEDPAKKRARERAEAKAVHKQQQADQLAAKRAAETPRTTRTAYLWWLVSIFGIFGGHYYYLGLPKEGTASIFTGGCFGLNAILDPFRIPRLVRNVNDGVL